MPRLSESSSFSGLNSRVGILFGAEINTYRADHGLRRLQRKSLIEGPAQAHVAQQPAFFDYPREALPESFHYTGPWRDPLVGGERTVFPWQRPDGRPLIDASMGTLQNRLQKIFETIAEACAGLARAADIVEQAISKRQPVPRNLPRARPGP